MSDPREEKLPVYVRNELRRLREMIIGLGLENAQLRESPGHSSVAFGKVWVGYEYKDVPLHCDIVRFKLPPSPGILEESLEVRVNERGLHVYHPGSGVLSIRPEAANVVTIRPVRP